MNYDYYLPGERGGDHTRHEGNVDMIHSHVLELDSHCFGLLKAVAYSSGLALIENYTKITITHFQIRRS